MIGQKDPTPTFYGGFFSKFFGNIFLVDFLWRIFVFDQIRKVKMSILYDNKIRIFFEENRRKTADRNLCYQ